MVQFQRPSFENPSAAYADFEHTTLPNNEPPEDASRALCHLKMKSQPRHPLLSSLEQLARNHLLCLPPNRELIQMR